MEVKEHRKLEKMPHVLMPPIFPLNGQTTLWLLAKDFEASVLINRKSEGYSSEIKRKLTAPLSSSPAALKVLDKDKIPAPEDGKHHRRWPRVPLERSQEPGRPQESKQYPRGEG